jgi:hypothetical protein
MHRLPLRIQVTLAMAAVSTPPAFLSHRLRADGSWATPGRRHGGVMATTVGETLADYLNVDLGLNNTSFLTVTKRDQTPPSLIAAEALT